MYEITQQDLDEFLSGLNENKFPTPVHRWPNETWFPKGSTYDWENERFDENYQVYSSFWCKIVQYLRHQYKRKKQGRKRPTYNKTFILSKSLWKQL